MMRSAQLLAAAAALAAALLATPALAQPDAAADDRDVRCVLVIAIYAGQSAQTAEARQGAAASLGYYFGRLRGRDPKFDLKARLLADGPRLDIANLRPDFARCGAEMKTFGLELQEIGAALKALGRPAGAD